jgi:4-oxalocrotonate tautomerase
MEMPFVQITMVQGRTSEMKSELIKKVTDAIIEAIHVPRDRIRVILNEVSKDNIGEGGVQLSKVNP